MRGSKVTDLAGRDETQDSLTQLLRS